MAARIGWFVRCVCLYINTVILLCVYLPKCPIVSCLRFNVLAKDRIKSIILLNRKFYFQRIIILLTMC